MSRWADGDFDPDTAINLTAPPPSFDSITNVVEQVQALDRAGLDSCVGGSFFPGIEAPRIMRNPATYAVPFRISDTLEAGQITESMALPWQTDFVQCKQAWWPAQRPNDVFVRSTPTAPPTRRKWYADENLGFDPFLSRWSTLGFVVPDGVEFVETERDEPSTAP